MQSAVWCRLEAWRRTGESALAAACLAAVAWSVPGNSIAQPTPAPLSARKPAVEQGPRFSELSADQRTALRPLEKEWPGISADAKQKWLQIAGQFAAMPLDERARIQTRMSEWSRLSPTQRGQVRMQFQEATRAAPQNRQAQWEAYQALSAEQKRQLASRAAAAPASTGSRTAGPAQRADPVVKPAKDAALTKSNIVPNPNFAPPPRSVAPTVVQAQPGATTNLISKRTAPPAHQQTGMPKIAASPGFVDSSTLLPRRGPQGAATGPVAASSPTPRSRP